MNKILVVIPTLDKDKGERVAEIIRMRAGINCTVKVIVDTEKKGWPTIHNEAVEKYWDSFEYYVYGCDDYFPARDFLKDAFISITTKAVGLLGFNDGKWKGTNATVGMVAKRHIHELYGGKNIFYKGYKMYGADPDLTARAQKIGRYYYDKNIIYIEVDFNKDLRNIRFEEGNVDHQLYLLRRKQGFPQ